jgi:hypothetical protein
MKRKIAAVAATAGLALALAGPAAAEDLDRGNHGPPWELTYEGNAVHPDVDSGQEWGEHNSSTTPEYVQDPFGPGISPGVHLLKENGPNS